MVRRYCDCCEKEILKYNNIQLGNIHRLSTSVTSKNGENQLNVEIVSSLNNMTDVGDFCKYCILDALYVLDDRE